MPVQSTDQMAEESLSRRTSVRLAEFLLSEQTVKTVSWFVVGSVFIGLVIVRLLGKYEVPTEILVFLFLGQGLLLVGFYYLQRMTFPPKHHPLDDDGLSR